MKQLKSIQTLNRYDDSDRFVYSLGDLRKLFPEDGDDAFITGVNRLVKKGILIRATRGVFVYGLSQNKHKHPLELIARTMRRGDYNYISLESALSEYGVISQVPIDRITVMTTGRRGEYKTPFGTIEFTHTRRSPIEIIDSTVLRDRPLRIARKGTALRDLKRVGRNLHLVEQGGLDD